VPKAKPAKIIKTKKTPKGKAAKPSDVKPEPDVLDVEDAPAPARAAAAGGAPPVELPQPATGGDAAWAAAMAEAPVPEAEAEAEAEAKLPPPRAKAAKKVRAPHTRILYAMRSSSAGAGTARRLLIAPRLPCLCSTAGHRQAPLLVSALKPQAAASARARARARGLNKTLSRHPKRSKTFLHVAPDAHRRARSLDSPD